MSNWKPSTKIALTAAVGAAVAAVGTIATAAMAQQAHGEAAEPSPQPGKAVYDMACAACHNAPEAGSRAPALAALRKMSAGTIRTALTTGVMQGVGSALTPKQISDVTTYLAAADTNSGTAWLDNARCDASRAAVELSLKATIAAWGVDADNSRRLTAQQAKLKTSDLANLEVAWTFAMPRTTGLRSQPVIVGNTLFYAAAQAGQVVALDTQTGCVKWNFATPSGIRTSLTYGELGKGGPLALVGSDSAGNVIAIDAKSGKQIWRVDPRYDKATPLSGSPLLVGERIIVPVSGSDVGAAGRPQHECCKTHGGLIALEAATGKVLWTYHTMENAKPLGRKNSAGAELYGPSGAPIWSSPSADLKKGVVYTATGENTSPPATRTSDAVIAVDLATGKEKWVFQALANDVWNMACPAGGSTRVGVNCFFAADGTSVLKDYDFGAGPVIFRAKGKDIILAGQKSGHVWALDAATGKKLWSQQFGTGTALGGVHWGLAVDGKRVFAPINDPLYPGGSDQPGMNAMDAVTGKVLWRWKAAPDCGNGRDKRIVNCTEKFGLSAAPLVVDGAVLAGSLDGKLWVFDAGSGAVLGQHDTATSFQASNGIQATGGSIDATGVFAGDGMVFVNSGYGSFNQTPGNVLVAFRPKAAR